MFSACLSLIVAAVVLSISCFLQLPQLSYGFPILPPDLTKCYEASDNSVVGPPITLYFNCCLPLPTKKVVDFSFEKYPLVKRRRGPAHKVSKAYIKKYNKAYELMKALPADDPRSFDQQAKVHCAFCNGAYRQLGNDIKLQVHFSWLFLPWHRWFLYFHERILAKLIDDPDFTLLFWNWDNQKQGNTLPAVFNQNETTIYDAKRNPVHVIPGTLVTLNVLSNTTDKKVIIAENLNLLYQGIVTASTAKLFMGGAYRLGVNDSGSTVLNAPLGGSIENGVHNAVHFWTGDPRQPLFQDMGTFTTAARDPIFYSHHSNIDRLWDVWRTLPGGRRHDHTNPDFLNSEFVFYDENANLVRVKVRDALDNKKLGIRYKKVKADKLWINYKPPAASNGSAINSSSVDVTDIGLSLDENATESIEVGTKVNVVVDLPSTPSAAQLKAKGVKKPEDLNEVLVIKEVEVLRDTFVHLMVFVNMPDADENTNTDSAEYVGTLNVAPAADSSNLVTNVELDIGDNLKRVGIQDAEKVVITILVKSHSKNATVKLKGMKIQFD